jgi:hypothetical protein
MQARNLKGIDMPFRPFGDFDNHDAPDDLSALEDDIYSRQDPFRFRACIKGEENTVLSGLVG